MQHLFAACKKPFSRTFYFTLKENKMQKESLFDTKKEEDLYAILGCVDTSSVRIDSFVCVIDDTDQH